MSDRDLALIAITIIVTSAFWLFVISVRNSPDIDCDINNYRQGYAEGKAGSPERYEELYGGKTYHDK